jgi:hypothetical protein
MVCLTMAFRNTAYAQSNAIGTSWSFSGIGITYERNVSEDAFAQVSLQAEMAETFIGRALHPGLSAAFSWNLVFAQIESRNGNQVRFYAGPGLAAGIGQDINTPPGLFVGLKGRIGMQCLFDRRINISVSLAPTLGIYISKQDEYVNARTYRHGLLQTFMPEVGISYRF